MHQHRLYRRTRIAQLDYELSLDAVDFLKSIEGAHRRPSRWILPDGRNAAKFVHPEDVGSQIAESVGHDYKLDSKTSYSLFLKQIACNLRSTARMTSQQGDAARLALPRV